MIRQTKLMIAWDGLLGLVLILAGRSLGIRSMESMGVLL